METVSNSVIVGNLKPLFFNISFLKRIQQFIQFVHHLGSRLLCLSQSFRSKHGNRFIQLIQFAALQFFAEDADFFSVLEAFYQTFETDTAAGTRIDTVCIAGCPSAEA